MTTFEIIVTIAIIAIVVLLVWLIHRINKVNDRYTEQFDILCEFSSGIRCDTVDIFQKLNDINDNILDETAKTNAKIDGFIPVFKKLLEHNESIENFWASDSSLVIKLLKEIRNCLTQDINWGELTDEQKSEILYRLTHPVVESPFKPPFNPTCETTNKED